MDWTRFSNPSRRRNPAARILIDRDRTNEARQTYDHAIVARFEDPVTLYRVLDGEELANIYASGQVEGGTFAVPDERAHGASWAAADPAELIKWGRSWQRGQRGRLGKDLFIAKIQGQGRWFYHMGFADWEALPFDEHGPAEQPVQIGAEECNTGLGCSIRAPREHVEFFRVTPADKIVPMSDAEIRAYLAKKPQKPVMLKSLGGTHAFGGTILGYTVIVAQDQRDKLWSVRDRNEREFVVGGKSKKQAVDAAARVIEQGVPPRFVRLNHVPPGFGEIQPGQVWERVRGSPRKFSVRELGASYVSLVALQPDAFSPQYFEVTAKEFLSEYRRAA